MNNNDNKKTEPSTTHGSSQHAGPQSTRVEQGGKQAQAPGKPERDSDTAKRDAAGSRSDGVKSVK